MINNNRRRNFRPRPQKNNFRRRSGSHNTNSSNSLGNNGNMYFNRTLNDWSKFDINKRTKYDATISSGLAIMACNRHLYTPNPRIEKTPIDIHINKYNNKGQNSKIINK